jgi:hypothetical protein
MMRHPLENVTKFVRDFKNSARITKRIKRTGHVAGDIVTFASSEWLRFRYGISPLMSDAKAVMKTLRKKYNSAETSLVKSRANGSTTRNGTTKGSTSDGAWSIAWTTSQARQISFKAVYYDKYVPSPFNDLGLTFQNVVGVAWELTRYSFVVDWFANIGDLMYANIPRVGVTPCGGSVTMRDISTTLISCGSVTDNTAGDGWVSTGTATDQYQATDTVTQRSRFDADGYGLVIKNDFRFDNWVRTTDAATLLSQFLHSISFEKH